MAVLRSVDSFTFVFLDIILVRYFAFCSSLATTFVTDTAVNSLLTCLSAAASRTLGYPVLLIVMSINYFIC